MFSPALNLSHKFLKLSKPYIAINAITKEDKNENKLAAMLILHKPRYEPINSKEILTIKATATHQSFVGSFIYPFVSCTIILTVNDTAQIRARIEFISYTAFIFYHPFPFILYIRIFFKFVYIMVVNIVSKFPLYLIF